MVGLTRAKLRNVYCSESVCKNLLKISELIWQGYKQERGYLVNFVRLSITLLKDEESARDNHVLAYNFAKYSPI